jgi:hypothetical protein
VVSDAKKSKRYHPNSKYGRNSVVVMSTAGWQESQEALKDTESSRSSGTALPNQRGVLKTEEVRVHYDRVTMGDENSIELKPFGQAPSLEAGKITDKHLPGR